jgi:protein-disulfide isomerase
MSHGNAGGGLRRFYILFGVLAVIGIAVLGYSVGSGATGRAATMPVDLEGTSDLRRLTELAVPITTGNADAPVTIIVFGDFLCNHCAAFSLRIRPQVESAFVETGQAKLLFYDFPLNPETGTFLAARAARCAGDQGRYWEYHDQLYRTQITWGGQREKLGILQDYAEELGLDGVEFRSCLNSDRHAAEVSANREMAHALGLGGTPSVLVGSGGGMSRRLPDYAFESIRDAVQAILGG